MTVPVSKGDSRQQALRRRESPPTPLRPARCRETDGANIPSGARSAEKTGRGAWCSPCPLQHVSVGGRSPSGNCTCSPRYPVPRDQTFRTIAGRWSKDSQDQSALPWPFRLSSRTPRPGSGFGTVGDSPVVLALRCKGIASAIVCQRQVGKREKRLRRTGVKSGAGGIRG